MDEKKEKQLKLIIEGCCRNDRKSQEQLYRMYFDKMYMVCRRYTDDEDRAMVILNNGFLKVFKHVKSFEFRGSFEGWVRRCVIHSVSDYFRKQKNKIKLVELKAAANESRRENALDKLYLDDVLQLLDVLPDSSRRVFELYAIEGYTHSDISKKLAISEGTSKWHLSNARKILRKLLQNQHIRNSYAG